MSAEAVPMTQEQLNAAIADGVKSAIGPAIKDALEPLTKANTETLTEFKAAFSKPSHSDEKAFDRKSALGKSHFGRAARILAMATIENKSCDPEAAAFAIKRDWPLVLQEPSLKYCQFLKATLLAGNAAAAGDIVIPQYDEEWIELLRNNTVVRGLPGVRTRSMPRGAISQRKQTGAATASYQGETDRMTPSNLTVGKANMSYKKLTAEVVVSNDLIRFGGPDVDQLVQDDLLAVSALREDKAFLLDNPPTDAASPQGIRYQTLAGNITASAGTTLANFQTDATGMITAVQAKNLPVTPANSGFIMSVSKFWAIYNLTTTTGDWMFKAGLEQARPTILGFPVYLSTQLEVSNSWIGANGGLMIFAHFPSLVIWDSMSRTVETFRGGAYYSPDLAAVASGISNDETVITCIAEHDFQQRYQEAAAIRTGLPV